MRVVIFLDRQHGIDALALGQRKDIDDGLATAGAVALWHVIDLEPVHPPERRKTQHGVVGVGDEQLLDEIVFAGSGRQLAATTATLRTVLGQWLRLDIAGMRESHHHVFRRDQVLDADFLGIDHDFAAPLVAIHGLHLRQLVGNDGGDALGLGQNVEVVGDTAQQFAVFAHDLVLLQAGQALQTHFQNGLGLRFGQAIAVGHQPQPLGQALRTGGGAVAGGTVEHVLHHTGTPGTRHQGALGFRRRGRAFDQLDDFIHIGQRHCQTFLDVRLAPRLAQLIHRAPGHHLTPVGEEGGQHVLEVEQAWLAVDQGHHVDTEAVLQLGVLVQIVQHHLGHLAALEIDHHPHAGLVGLVLHMRNALDALVMHQLGNTLEQALLVDLVRQLVHHDGLAATLLGLLEMGAGADHHPAASGAVALTHATNAVDDAGGGKVRRRHALDEFLDIGLRIVQQQMAGIHHFAQIVRRDVGGHTHGNTGRTIDQQVGNARRQGRGLHLLAVIVGHEIDGFLVNIGQQLGADALQPAFGVAVGCGRIAIDGAKVALAINQHVAHGEVLRHAHQRLVSRRVAVRVVLTQHLTHHPRALHIGAVPDVVGLMHGKQHPAVHRLESVTHIRQCPADDHAHGVIEIGATHLLFETDREGFLGELIHDR